MFLLSRSGWTTLASLLYFRLYRQIYKSVLLCRHIIFHNTFLKPRMNVNILPLWLHLVLTDEEAKAQWNLEIWQGWDLNPSLLGSKPSLPCEQHFLFPLPYKGAQVKTEKKERHKSQWALSCLKWHNFYFYSVSLCRTLGCPWPWADLGAVSLWWIQEQKGVIPRSCAFWHLSQVDQRDFRIDILPTPNKFKLKSNTWQGGWEVARSGKHYWCSPSIPQPLPAP